MLTDELAMLLFCQGTESLPELSDSLLCRLLRLWRIILLNWEVLCLTGCCTGGSPCSWQVTTWWVSKTSPV